MAHFAKLGANGKVIAVLTLNNSDMLNASGVEDESVGQQYLERHNNWPAQMWIQTSYNTLGGKHNKGGTPFYESTSNRKFGFFSVGDGLTSGECVNLYSAVKQLQYDLNRNLSAF